MKYYIYFGSSITTAKDTGSWNYFDEQKRIILDDFTLGPHYFAPFILRLGRSGVLVDTFYGTNIASAISQLEELGSALAQGVTLQKYHLRHIYQNVCSLFGSDMSQELSYPERCPGYPGYAKVGRVAVDLGRWTLEQTVNSERSVSQCLKFVAFYCFLHCLGVLIFNRFTTENRQSFIACYLRIRITPFSYFPVIIPFPRIDSSLCFHGL